MPVFIGGAERSGTSLMRAMLGSHPDLAIYQWDLPYWIGLWPAYRYHRLTWRRHRAAVVDRIEQLDKYQLADADLPLDRVRDDSTIRTWGDLLDRFMSLYAQELGRPQWGLKTPYNELYADVIFRHFPDARFVQLVRDPRDVAVSIRHMAGGTWAYDPAEHAADWRRSVEAGEQNLARWPNQYRMVRYEDLVADREGVIRDVAEFCGLTGFDSAMLDGSGHVGWRGSNSSFQSGGARQDRDPEFVAEIEQTYVDRLGDLMFRYGYLVHEPDTVGPDRGSPRSSRGRVKAVARALKDLAT